MNYVVRVRLLDEAMVAVLVCHIELLVLAREVKTLIRSIASDDTVSSEFLNECIDEGHADLPLAACE